MGFVILKYKLDRLKVSPATLVNEIEYGSTFALYPDREEIIPNTTGYLKWLSWEEKNKNLIIRVDDSFLEIDSIFEKLLIVFFYNLLDFGDIQLLSIDFSGSSYLTHTGIYQQPTPQIWQLCSKHLMLGTILKPYYHLSLSAKIRLIEKFIGKGISIIKEDETFLVSTEQLLEETKSIKKAMGEHGIYIPNLTHQVCNYDLIEKLFNCGTRVIMIDFLAIGFRNVYEIKRRFPELCVWGHRVGYMTLERFISMNALGSLALLAGIDFLHIGTPNNENDILDRMYMVSKLRQIHPTFIPVLTKTTPALLPQLIKSFGNTSVYMACGYFRKSDGITIDWIKVEEWVSSAENAKN